MRQFMACGFLVCGFLVFLMLSPAQAQISGQKVKIGVLTDLAGPRRAELGRRFGGGRQDGGRGVWQQN